MKKYKILNESIVVCGVKLYRIQALRDGKNFKKGDLGGWIEGEKNLSQEGDAWICGDAQVSESALVSGSARVSGDAIATRNVINMTGFKYNITITDNMVQVGCRQWLVTDIKKIKYNEVKNECDKKTFDKMKKIIIASLY